MCGIQTINFIFLKEEKIVFLLPKLKSTVIMSLVLIFYKKNILRYLLILKLI